MSELRLGLEGVSVAESQISHVDGENGELIYRGQWVENIVKDHTYEDIIYLLWYGHMPSSEEVKKFKETLVKEREIPKYIKDIINLLPKNATPMEALRTAISAYVLEDEHWPPKIEQAIRILAKVPTIIAYHYNLINGKKEVLPNPKLSHAANYLYMLTNKEPKESHVKALDTYLMLSADHDMNASTFTARVVTSTRSDIISAIVAAIGALIGPLHGGAPSHIDDMLDAIGTEENAEPWLRQQLEAGERLMGFGHRVYKTYDPRAAVLREIAKKFAHESKLFKLSLHVEKVAVKLLAEYKPGRDLYPNLEFWAAGVLRTIELPRELYTPTFCLARVGGWSAHIMEQAEHNRLIRPTCTYVGPQPKGHREKLNS